MPDPQAHPASPQVRRVALHALIAGVVLMALKFTLFGYTNSAAVLSDALESIINLVAAGMLLYSAWLANRPADREHPYGHGKIEFMAIGLEGWLILTAGVIIFYQAIARLFRREQLYFENLNQATWMLGGVALLSLGLAIYVFTAGKRLNNAPLVADGKHLFVDAASTLGGVATLYLVRLTGKHWLDPLIAMAMALLILYASWKLLWQSVHGLMDRIDPEDDAAIIRILDEEVTSGAIRGYHKVRHRHNGAFHWVDMHLQVEPDLSVRQSHDLASRIEHRIEEMLGQANATAHVEPWETAPPPPISPTAASPPDPPIPA